MSSGSTVAAAAATDDLVLGRRLLVHVAENGHSVEFDCDGSTAVVDIQRSIESLCGIALGDQLLLCGNTSLDSQQPLSAYKLPRDDKEVFLYSKARLHADAPPPLPEAIDIPSPVVPSPPPPPPPQDSHSLDMAIDPALNALITYEHKFLHHFQLANAVYSCSQAKFEACKRLLREQQVQERALDNARANLDLTFRKLHQRYMDFVKCYSKQRRGHSELLGSFQRDMGRLQSLKLHPALRAEGRKFLIDLVKEYDLQKWANSCLNSHRRFEDKVSQLKLNFSELQRRVQELSSTMNSGGCKDLELWIQDHQKTADGQKTIMQALSKDVSTAKKLVDDSSKRQLSASIRPHDTVSAVGRINDVHENSHLPIMRDCESTLSKLLDKCKTKKNEMNLLVHTSMQKVKSVQFSIKDMINELHAFHEVLKHQERDFENLKLASGIGHAYRACLAEVVRRRSCFKLYMGLAGQLAERLATEREIEIRGREDFFRRWSRYIPHDMLRSLGLFDSPSQCDVNIAPFDRELLQIDLDDVDRLAPPSLLGLLSRSEKMVISKSSLTDENLLHTSEKVEFHELEGFDIAGTSKMEVENAKLKADLASATAIICSFGAGIEYNSVGEDQIDNVVNNMKEKTTEALHLKDEYANHLQIMLNKKHEQCLSYEKRIRELEKRLADQFVQGQKNSSNKDASDYIISTCTATDCNIDISRDGQVHLHYASATPMDEASSTSASVDPRLDSTTGQENKHVEGGDEHMANLSGTLHMPSMDSTRNPLDASMLEHQVSDINKQEKTMTSNAQSEAPLSFLPCGTNYQLTSDAKNKDSLILDLQNALVEKSNQLDDAESKLRAVMEEVDSLTRRLEHGQNLLDESQMNCAHLENCLHEAREEAQTNKCATDRRAAEYDALRSSALRIHGLFERLCSCVTAPGVPGLAESLRSLALSLASSVNKDEGDFSVEFQQCIKVLADKVGFLSRQAAELLERCSRMETARGHLVREVEEKKELIKNMYTKHQLEKQASKEKISFGRFEVHELAAFVQNSAGNYEALNRNCSNYYLSEESVALFAEQHQSQLAYIIGQIVHIEQRIVRPSMPAQTEDSRSGSSGRRFLGSGAALNPYNLPVGCKYFVVTVAMLPDTIHSTAS